MDFGNIFGFGGDTPFGNIPSSLPDIFQGLFGNSGAPYEKANKAYKPYYQEGKGFQNPFYQAGTSAIPQMQDFMSRMQDPSAFLQHLMSGYQQSPQANLLKQQAMRAGTNAASMGGLPNGMGGAGIGSTPFAQQMQQNAGDISSMDIDKYLQNLLGINTQYGQGLGGMMNSGQHAGDIMSQLAQSAGQYAGGTAYGKEIGKQQDQRSLWNGITGIFGG